MRMPVELWDRLQALHGMTFLKQGLASGKVHLERAIVLLKQDTGPHAIESHELADALDAAWLDCDPEEDSLEYLLYKHLEGEHDQADHAPSGGGGKKANPKIERLAARGEKNLRRHMNSINRSLQREDLPEERKEVLRGRVNEIKEALDHIDKNPQAAKPAGKPDEGGWSDPVIDKSGSVKLKERIGEHNIGVVYKVEEKDGSTVVYKPKKGSGLEKWPNGGLRAGLDKKFPEGKRDLLAYEISEELGLGNVPKVIDGVDYGDGAGHSMEFVKGRPVANTFLSGRGLERAIDGNQYSGLKFEAEKLAALDYIIGNTDRHEANFMAQKTGETYKLVAIDNGLAFPDRTDGYEFRSAPANALRGRTMTPQAANLIKGWNVERVLALGRKRGLSEFGLKAMRIRFTRLQNQASSYGTWPDSRRSIAEVD